MNENFADGLKGAFYGAILGGAAGLAVCTLWIDEPPFFAGDTILIGAVTCGALGFWKGEPFLDWLEEVWHRVP